MAVIAHLYPRGPANVSADLGAPSPSYRFRVFVVLFSLGVFVAVYLLLTVGSAYLCYSCFAAVAEDEPKPAPTYPQYTTYPQSAGDGSKPRGYTSSNSVSSIERCWRNATGSTWHSRISTPR